MGGGGSQNRPKPPAIESVYQGGVGTPRGGRRPLEKRPHKDKKKKRARSRPAHLLSAELDLAARPSGTKKFARCALAPVLVHWPSPEKIVARHVDAEFGFVDWAFFSKFPPFFCLKREGHWKQH